MGPKARPLFGFVLDSFYVGGLSTGTWTPTKRRGPIAAEFQTPGPAAVILPSTIGSGTLDRGRAPAFSFGVKHDNKTDSPGPGPGQYNVAKLNNKGKDETPAPTISGRPKDPKLDITPAPGSYNPEKGEKLVVEGAPAFSFGVKLNNNKPDNTPAPNQYSLPAAMGAGQAPAYSLAGRGKSPSDERIHNPGPGRYDTASPEKYKAVKSPSFSISVRTNIPSDHTQKPGPGAHSPEKITMERSPAHTFGVKHSVYAGHIKE